ncbi:hypothetical protein LTR84_010366 [Exophiala bonariae]|uniref:Uncharacterized protein n=1 Tax=Exophiala bonariae TaxID=1690606 RepID=A0AAV9MTJ3_9EURO|nr:hypothetical protein LTR84_010366 [Exophiala bonariae]
MVKAEILGYLCLVFLSRFLLTLMCHVIWCFYRNLAIIKSYLVFPGVKYLKNLAVCIIRNCLYQYRNESAAFRALCLLMDLGSYDRSIHPCLLNLIGTAVRDWVVSTEGSRRELTTFLAGCTLTPTTIFLRYCTQSLIISIQGWFYVYVELYRDCHGNVTVILAEVLLVKIVIIQERFVPAFDFENSLSPYDEYPSVPLEIEDLETDSESDHQSSWSLSNGTHSFYRRGSLSTIEEVDEDMSETQSTTDQDNEQGLQLVPYHASNFAGLEYEEFDNDSDSDSGSEYSDFSWDTKEVDDDTYSQSEYSDNESAWESESAYSDDEASIDYSNYARSLREYQTEIRGAVQVQIQVLGKRRYDAAFEDEVSEEMLAWLNETY